MECGGYAVGFLLGTCFAVSAGANPTDGTISAGNASIAASGPTTTISQSTDRAVIDWRGFDIGAGETTQFMQPSSTSVTLNRVNSNAPSRINGNLTANGNLVIVNPNGVWFGSGSRVDVNGLIASTADISNDALMNAQGKLKFEIPGDPNAAVINDGMITAKEAGLVGLVAPSVVNRGMISARLGRVHLASGDTATVDLYGDGLMQVAVSDAVQSQLVENSGLIMAEGGTIAITAAAGKGIVNSLINVAGELHSPTVSEKAGKIIIAAEGANAIAGNVKAAKGKKSGSSTVLVSGTLNASGRNAGQHGGSIQVTADNVAILDGALIDATGSDGASGTTNGLPNSAYRSGSAGGDIRIGGDYLGQGDTPTARNLYVASGALILNDALNSGDAGRTIFWSDGATSFYGNVYARALGGKTTDGQTWNAITGGNQGNGGFVETSGHEHIDVGGYVDLTASNGERGTYFLDPTNIAVYGNFTPNYGTVIQGDSATLSANLKLWLDASDTSSVTLTYSPLTTAGANNCAASCLTANGISGATTITTSANIASSLQVGQRIRLSSAGSVTAASTLGADTYTIASISGTTITLTSALATAYTGATVYGGYVSQLTDKSTSSANFTQGSAASMPLWMTSAAFNNLGVARFTRTSNTSGQYLTLASGNSGYTALNNSVFETGSFWLQAVAQTSTGGFDGATNAAEGIIERAGYHVGLRFGGYPNTTSAVFDSWSGGNTFFSSPALGATQGTNYIVGGGLSYNGSVYTPNVSLDGTILAGSTLANVQSNTTSISIGASFPVGGSYTYYLNGFVPEVLAYGTFISSNARNLVEQYQSAKWGIALTPPGSGATEAAQATASIQKGNAVDGYSVFTTRYLEYLSQSANISLQASNNIILDLQGDTLNFTTAGRSLSLTAGNQITTASTGTITTNGGNISMTAANDIVFNNALTLNTGGGNITLNSPVILGADITLNSANGATTVNAINGNTAGTRNVTISAGTGTFTTTGVIGATNKLNNLTVTADDVVLGGNISGSGALTLQPATNTRTVNVNAGVADGTNFNISSAEVAYFVNGWNQINLGSTSSSTHNILLGSPGQVLTFQDDFVLRTPAGGYQNGTLAMVDGASFTSTSSMDLLGAITTNGGAVTVTGPLYGKTALSSISTNGGIVTVGGLYTWDNGLGASITTSGGNIVITGASGESGTPSGTRAFTLDAGIGSISFGGIVNGAISYTATAAAINLNGFSWGGITPLANVSLTSTNSISLPSIRASSIFVRASGATSDITITAGNILNATGTGTPLTLVAARNFINNAGAGALSALSGRWLVYSSNPADDTIGGLSNAFRRFSCAYGYSCPTFPSTGNGLLYSTTPVLTVSPNSISSIVYGEPVPSLTDYGYSLAGYLASDGSADSVSGSLTGRTGYFAGSNVGTYNIDYGSGSLTSALGYGFTYANSADAFTVTARPISVSADAKTKRYGAPDPALTYQITAGSLLSSDRFSGTLTRAAGETVLGSPYAIGQGSVSAGGNYIISYLGNDFSIIPASLTATPNSPSKNFSIPVSVTRVSQDPTLNMSRTFVDGKIIGYASALGSALPGWAQTRLWLAVSPTLAKDLNLPDTIW